MTSQNKSRTTGRLHLDRRASSLIAAAVTSEGGADDLLTTQQVANWLGVSTQWMEIQRDRDTGPPFQRLAPQLIRYKRDTVLTWLKQREYARTSQYRESRSNKTT
ncbi:helix-turn-helix transcriptional regulator [Bradyrhizobium sp. URHC0002]